MTPTYRRRLSDLITDWIAIATLLSLILPQSQYFGRGLRATAVLFFVWLGFAIVNLNVLGFLWRFRVRASLALLFIPVVIGNYMFRGGTQQHLQFVHGTLAAGVAFTIVAIYSQYPMERLRRIRFWTIAILGIAVVPSIPLLYSDPGIARPLATGDVTGIGYDPTVMAFGVGSYSLYTGIGIVLPALLATAIQVGAIRKVILAGTICMLIAVTVLSTFAGAVALLTFGGLASLAAFPFLLRSWYRWLSMAMIALLIVVVAPGVAMLYQDSAAVRFVVDKAERLYDGITGSGIVEGEETGRAIMFFNTLRAIRDNPIIGAGHTQRETTMIGGHSSLVDHWATYGLVGYLPWFLLQVICTWIALARWSSNWRDVGAFASSVSWVLFWIGSAVNPTAFLILPWLLVFTDCMIHTPGLQSGFAATAMSPRMVPPHLQIRTRPC
jgi:O-antigen ligase